MYQYYQKLQESKEQHYLQPYYMLFIIITLRKNILRCFLNFQQIEHLQSQPTFTENVYNTGILKHIKFSKDCFCKENKMSAYFVFHGIASVENSW